MTTLVLPSGFKPSGLWKKRGHGFGARLRSLTAWAAPVEQPREHPGRPVGKPEGTYVLDLVALKKVILLCWKCQPKFNHGKANYYKDGRFPHVIGKCDGCRDIMNHQTRIYIHESFLGEPGGNTKAGQCWTPI